MARAGEAARTLVRGGANAKHQAIRRLAAVAFFVFAAISILVPDLVTSVARFLGIGRGTDLVLYALVMGFAFVTVSTYVRFREQELRYSRLARTIALQNAVRPDEEADARVVEPAQDDDPLRR